MIKKVTCTFSTWCLSPWTATTQVPFISKILLIIRIFLVIANVHIIHTDALRQDRRELDVSQFNACPLYVSSLFLARFSSVQEILAMQLYNVKMSTWRCLKMCADNTKTYDIGWKRHLYTIHDHTSTIQLYLITHLRIYNLHNTIWETRNNHSFKRLKVLP